MDSEEKVIKYGNWEATITIKRSSVRLDSMSNYNGVGTDGRDLRGYSDFCLKVFEEMATMQFLLDTTSN